MAAAMTEAERQRLADDALWSEATAVIFPGSWEHSENVSREHSKNVSREVSRDGSPEISHRGPLADRAPPSPIGLSSPKPIGLSSPKGMFRLPFQLPAHELRRQSVHLAQGGFGHVFRVERLPSLPSAGPVAVKQLKAGSIGEAEAAREVALLSCCRHKHILPLLGYTALKISPICLVYPLMTGGTLEDRVLLAPEAWPRLQALGHTVKPPPLQWWHRLRILRDTTRALVYLHTPTPGKPRTLHADVKPANILLDDSLEVCLADFGLAHSDDNPNPTTTAAAAATAAANRHCMLPPSVTPRTPHHSQMPPATPSGYTTPSLPRSLADSPPRLAPRLTHAASHAASARAADAADAAGAFRAGPRPYRLPTDDTVPVWDDVPVPSDARPAAPASASASGPPSLPQSPERRPTMHRRAHPSPVTEEKVRRPQRSNLDDEICARLPPALALAAAAQKSPSASLAPRPPPPWLLPPGSADDDRAPAAAAAGHDRPLLHEGRPFDPEVALEWAQLPTAAGPSLRGTPEFVDPLYVHLLHGQASELTDGYALGLTILVTLTGQPISGHGNELMQRCRGMLMHPDERERWEAPGRPDPRAGNWPARVACGLARLVAGLAWENVAEQRLPLPEALKALEHLVKCVGGEGGVD